LRLTYKFLLLSYFKLFNCQRTIVCKDK